PQDPKYPAITYVYKTNGRVFNLFADLENKSDSHCEEPPYNVDGVDYCYGVTSPNTIVDPSQF
ncbi:MAG: hypothetical protein PHH12_00530, partial [Candidatus Shapirobacteria bacterium]|nr:hypothetical protein [Candidatus Shapirobacteria bacterium]